LVFEKANPPLAKTARSPLHRSYAGLARRDLCD
jgi:hypothetical protein